MRFAQSRNAIQVVALVLCVAVVHGNAQQRSAIMTVDARKVENAISPGLYGQFVEVMFGGIDGPLWTELIRNRSFEEPANEIGLSRFWEREPDDRNHDPAVHFAWDESTFYPANPTSKVSGHSLRVEVRPNQWNATQRRGVSQGRIALRQGVAYNGYVWLKAVPFDGFVTVALEKDSSGARTYASTELHPTGDGWAKYSFKLTPDTTDSLAKFSILVNGIGTIWIDQVSLIPGDAVAGTRADVFQKIKALRPSFVRWPGGNVAQDYHWMRGVGARDDRPTWVNRAWWNEIESGDFGTDEFLQFCQVVGTLPSITVNVEGSGATAEEAAAWVEYVNGPATSKYGRMRAANGHPEPYGVKLWEVGNEIFGAWEIGHTDAETYGRNFNRYAAAMKAVDPTIRLIASGNDLLWNRTLVQIAGPNIDQIAIHFYYGEKEMHGDWTNLLAHPLTVESSYEETRKMLHEVVPDNHIHLTINEWNTSLPTPAQHTMKSALYAGSMLNGFERNGDLIASTAVSDLVNGWSAGIIQASRDGIFVTPTYLVNKLYSDHLGAKRLLSRVQGPTFDTSLQGNGIPILDAIATRSTDGSKIFIKAVNKDLQNALTLKLHVDGAPLSPNAEVDSITAASAEAANNFADPDAVSLRSSRVKAGEDFTVELPSDSVSVLTLHVTRSN